MSVESRKARVGSRGHYHGLFVNTPDQFEGTFNVTFRHRVLFERHALGTGTALAEVLGAPNGEPVATLAVLDDGLVHVVPELPGIVEQWFDRHASIASLTTRPMVLPGSERAKHGTGPVAEPVVEAIRSGGLCRRSNILAIGGGALLDAVGLGASLAHRGVRLVRMPTTTLSQGDAGIGVKNGVNIPGVTGGKNLLGTFAVPAGVVNDTTLLTTLDDTHWRGGLAESIKVALVKDASLLESVESNAVELANRDLDCMERVLKTTAKLHLRHITEGGDPFESELARPLDFGHWAAHELEARSDWSVPHGEAVAMGMVIDLQLGEAAGLTEPGTADRIESLLRQLGFLQTSCCGVTGVDLLHGLEHFRQHLGGKLTICMIQAPGTAIDVHDVDMAAASTAIDAVLGALPRG